jgi:NTP pyrophosphatase (non-canonical NTP hydrolase)
MPGVWNKLQGGKMSLNETAQAIGEWAKKKGWNSPWDLNDKLLLTHTEISEAKEELRDGHLPTEIYFNGTKPEGFPIELADVFIRLLHICAMEGIDIEHALELKMTYNEKRPLKHGRVGDLREGK